MAEFVCKVADASGRVFSQVEPAESIDEAFRARFGVKQMPEELNATHDLAIVSGAKLFQASYLAFA